MCFSPTISFFAGSALVGVGAYAIKKTNSKYFLLSSFPILFGIQQIIEGILWLKIESGEDIKFPLLGFLFFSHFLWLIWTPLAVLKTEKEEYRKLICKICFVSGLLLGIVFYIPALLSDSLFQVSIEQNSICYRYILAKEYSILKIFLLPYTIIILAPLLISSDVQIRILGIIITISMFITYLFYQYAFTSIWCFFAAIASFYIVYFLGKSASQKKL